MPYKFLKTSNPWEIILKEADSSKEFSLMDRYSDKCPVCHYPLASEQVKLCHIGLEKNIDKISYITGHYYETDFTGNPNNWYGKLLKDISEQPFRHSHEPFVLVLKERLVNSDWDIDSLNFATMVPTSNQQMENLFIEVSELLNVRWVKCNDIFLKRELVEHYNNRSDYVKNKYFISKTASDLLLNFKDLESILIFDDILNQGYTFGCLIDLLKATSIKNYYLVTIARTLPKVFQKTFSFP